MSSPQNTDQLTDNNPLRHLPLLLEPEELEPLLSTPNLLVVDLSTTENYLRGHIPGAVHLPGAALQSGEEPAKGKLPDPQKLEAILASIGYHPDKHIVAYDDEGGGWAGRFIWTLDCIGHLHSSYLNGGRVAWAAESRALTTEPSRPEPTSPQLQLQIAPRADKERVLLSLKEQDTVIWDARSPAEFHGEQQLALRNGHIPGAINLEWTMLMDPNRQLRIREDSSKILNSLGITRDKLVITHCQSHHRSGFTYLVAKVLGYQRLKAYDGSWSEWGNDPNTPIEQ
ncbi:sulfurtransferase [Zooshikella ganghwensis]|uniref:Sulfurtransferase n=1 Tax=Zooshikella ganghwensis TaxID=202772 RepID=A0A4P9VJT0_9GAMM|nr:rhodanese-like domain-containing protein [Zooshikella ganghwensis]RDH42497.1 sulfurtransferase [Zooshikella ganghwensis]